MAKTQNSKPAAKPAKGAKAPAAKSGQQAPAKVEKIAKGAKPAAKPEKSAPAKAATNGQRAPRNQFAGMSIRNLLGKGESKTRGDAEIRFQAIVAHKRVDDAIGSTYTTAAGEERAIVAADVAYLVKRGLIEVA